MPDCDLTLIVNGSGESVEVAASVPGTGAETLLTKVIDNNEAFGLTLTGNPAGSGFTLTWGGQTTASIASSPGAPAAYGQWNVTGLGAGAIRDLAVNIFQGGTASPHCAYDILDDTILLATVVLNHINDSGGGGGPTNPASFLDGSILNLSATPLKWYPLGRYTSSTGILRVRISCPGNDSGGRNRLDADQLRVATIDGLTVVRQDSTPSPFTSVDPIGAGGRSPLPSQAADSGVGTYQLDGLGASTRYLVDPAEAQSKFQAISSVGAGNATFAGNGSAFTPLIGTFVGALGNAAQALPTSSDAAAVVSEVAHGGGLPLFHVTRSGTPLTPFQTTSGMVNWYPGNPTMPALNIHFPQAGPTKRFETAFRRENAFPTGAWNNRFDGGSVGHGMVNYTGQVRRSVDAGATAEFRYWMTTPGTFQIWATWPHDPGLTTDAVYTARDVDGTLLGTFRTDQTADPSGSSDGELGNSAVFQLLGTVTIGPSANGGPLFNGIIVTLSNGGTPGTTLMADTLKFVRTSADTSFKIQPGDVVTCDFGAGFLTSQYGPAPAGSGVAVTNFAGGDPFGALPTSATMRAGWNSASVQPSQVSRYTNRFLNNDSLRTYPTVLHNGTIGATFASAGVTVANSAVTYGADRKNFPNIAPGRWVLLWDARDTSTVASDITMSNGINAGNGCIEDVSGRVIPGPGNLNQRRVYTLTGGDFHWGSEIGLNLSTSVALGGGDFACNITNVRVFPEGTDEVSPPQYTAIYESILGGCGTNRNLETLGAIQSNSATLADYIQDPSRASRKTPYRTISLPMAGTTIRQYTGSEYSFDPGQGVVYEYIFPVPHGLMLGQLAFLNNYTGDLAHVQFGATTEMYQIASDPLFIWPLADPTRFVCQAGFTGRTAMLNVITNAGGTLDMDAGSGGPLQDLVDASNFSGANFHLDTHFATTDAAHFGIGQFLGTHLNPGTKVVHEHSNEVWNFGNTPQRWAARNSWVKYHSIGGTGDEYKIYYVHESINAWTQGRAGWVAAGRDPADWLRALGSCQAQSNISQDYAILMDGLGETFDVLLWANYVNNTPSFVRSPGRPWQMRKILDGLTADQQLDLWETNYRHGGFPFEVQAHRDAMTGPGPTHARPQFLTTLHSAYEGGPSQLVAYGRDDSGHEGPYPPPRIAELTHRISRHPRFFRIGMHILKIYDAQGMYSANWFLQYGTEGAGLDDWGHYFGDGQTWYVPGDPTQDATQVDDFENLPLIKSVTGGVIKAFSLLLGAGGALAPGTATGGAVTATTAAATATDATLGTSPYTYQWYRSTSSGVLGSAVSGQTTRTLADTGLTASTAYYYTLRYTDAASAHVDSNQVTLTTSAAAPTASVVLQNIPAFRNLRAG